ncbi:MAG: transcription-repair coupling factor [Clostridia bacterium]|nr:transcription-repair coupling factor [Clostridia bacterium]
MSIKDRFACLYAPLEELSHFNELVSSLKAGGVSALYGPDDTQRAHMLAAAQRKLGRPMLVLAPNDVAAQRLAEDMNALTDGGCVFMPARDVSFLKTAASSRELSMRRIEALGAAVVGELKALIAPIDAVMHRLMPAAAFREKVLMIDESMCIQPGDLMEKLTQAGYERVQLVEARGQCALRGGILDVYPVGEPNALRIEFFDDEIDSIRSFDVMTQRSISRRESARIFPAAEMLPRDEECLRAAHELEYMLRSRTGEMGDGDRQKQLEEEFDLIPMEDFLELTYVGGSEDELPEFGDLFAEKPKKAKKTETKPKPKKPPVKSVAEKIAPPKNGLERNFSGTLDALETGRRVDGLDALLPVLLDYRDTAADYLDDPVIVFDQPERLRERCENRMLEFKEQYTAALQRDEALPAQGELLLTYDELLAKYEKYARLIANPFMRTEQDFRPKALIKPECRNATGYQTNIKELARDLKTWIAEGWRVALLSGGVARGQRLEGALKQHEVVAHYAEEVPGQLETGKPAIFPLAIGRGFIYPEIKFAVVSESDVYGGGHQRKRGKVKSGEKLAAFTELKVGDYVVHENHGIGQYMGTIRLSSDGTYRDFLHIRYQGSDKLYVPTDQLDRVQKYIGSEGEAPKLNRLSGGEWQRQKAKVKTSIRELAGELIKLYAHREATPGHAFDPDTPWQRELEDAFPYDETPDQLTAIEEIKRDMERPKIMDRLLCGDVGYGKTEVALRAIFKCVMGGKQAALLAPTTILVQQHLATMMNRFHGFPVRIESLSRFKTAAEQKAIMKQLKNGEIDVVVGTHRLLAKDVEFKDLGLLVVDEEQRFGVAHKEGIKKLKRTVDVLTLTATPIPRTLHMSMVGIRDMSLLQSPPDERYPVQTYVVEYSDGLVRDAILRELSRGGQVYVLYNRVQTIDMMYARLKKLVPEARIGIGHGQMREHALEDVMMDFYEGKFDVLLCTTIIEAGLDVPRANTLIVCDADRFGLSQLYQIRGRVGRSNRLAYAYFTVNPAKVLTENADKRLSAIREFTEFGSGFRVAMRDLEIRGAGNLLGSEQSGFMASVGYDLYVKMIDDTVKEMRGDVSQGDVDTRVDLKMDAYLPQDYVYNDILRVEMYKKIASVRTDDDRDDLIEELIDRFGDPNRPVMNLIDIAQMKNLCSRLGIDLVSMKGDKMHMRFSIAADIDFMLVLMAAKKHEQNLRVLGNNPPVLVYFDKPKMGPEDLIKGAVTVMTEVVEEFENLAKASFPGTAPGEKQ